MQKQYSGWSIFTAIFAGLMLGAMAVHQLAHSWYQVLLGALSGGLFGYIVVDPKGARQALPVAWHMVRYQFLTSFGLFGQLVLSKFEAGVRAWWRTIPIYWAMAAVNSINAMAIVVAFSILSLLLFFVAISTETLLHLHSLTAVDSKFDVTAFLQGFAIAGVLAAISIAFVRQLEIAAGKPGPRRDMLLKRLLWGNPITVVLATVALVLAIAIGLVYCIIRYVIPFAIRYTGVCLRLIHNRQRLLVLVWASLGGVVGGLMFDQVLLWALAAAALGTADAKLMPRLVRGWRDNNGYSRR